METLCWWITILLMITGVAGTVVPLIPGAVLIFVGAGFHRWMLGAEGSVGWWTLGGLLLLTLISQGVDLLSGVAGARYFGATKWGAIGGILGGVIGIFFGLPGLLIGPLAGVLLGELLGGQRLLPATKSTWGTLIGAGVGFVIRFAIAVTMVIWFFAALWWG